MFGRRKGGYQPDGKPLDTSNPPQGGSGVPVLRNYGGRGTKPTGPRPDPPCPCRRVKVTIESLDHKVLAEFIEKKLKKSS